MSIMVVEDDFLIRMILVEELTDAGFEVTAAETGDEAVRLLGELEPSIEVLVTDIHMPGSRNGIELASYVRARRPDVPIIYTTGRPDALSKVSHLGQNQILIRKPYVPAEIISRIRELILS